MYTEKKSYLKYLMTFFFKGLLCIAYRIYKLDGVNALFYFIPPSLIVPALRKYGATIGNNVAIHTPLIIHNAKNNFANLEIGDDAYVGRDVFLDITDKIKIGNRVVIGMRTTLLTHFDAGKSSIHNVLPPARAPLLIEDDAYIGAGSIIKSRVTIGKRSLVAAMSFVNKDVPENTVVGGVPARPLRRLEQ
ncbi:MAG: DapH/DapD/GlmU-related protein [Candidatus Omnitrophota bacterium]